MFCRSSTKVYIQETLVLIYRDLSDLQSRTEIMVDRYTTTVVLVHFGILSLTGCENVHCAVVKIQIELKSAVHFPRGKYCALMAELNSLFVWSPPQLVDNNLSSTTFKFLPAKVIIDPLSNYKAYKSVNYILGLSLKCSYTYFVRATIYNCGHERGSTQNRIDCSCIDLKGRWGKLIERK